MTKRVWTLIVLAGCGTSHIAQDAGMLEDDATVALLDAGDLEDAGSPALDAAPIDAGAPDAAMIDAGTIDAGMVERTGTIECGAQVCDRATHGCLASCQRGDVFEPACVRTDAEGRWPSEECPSADEQFPRYWLTCDGPEDCAEPEGCRLTFGSLGQYTYCNFGSERLCHDASDCLPAAPRCEPTPNLPGYSTCVE